MFKWALTVACKWVRTNHHLSVSRTTVAVLCRKKRSATCLSAKWRDASKRLCRENDWKAARELKILQRLKFWGMVTFLSIFVFFCRQISKLAKNWSCNFSSTKFLARLQLSLEQKWPKRAVACKEKRLLCAFCLTYSMEEPGNAHLDSEGGRITDWFVPLPLQALLFR